jgi:hypothetical protein
VKIKLGYVLQSTISRKDSTIKEHRPAAELLGKCNSVRRKNQNAGTTSCVSKPLTCLSQKDGVPHSDYFVDEENITFDPGRDSITDAHAHSRRKNAGRHIGISLKLGEIEDILDKAAEAGPAHAAQNPGKPDVFDDRALRVGIDERKQRRYAAGDAHGPAGRGVNATEHVQKGSFSSAVPSEKRYARPVAEMKRDVIERSNYCRTAIGLAKPAGH